MKLKSLILGTVAAAGLSTGAFAADLGVLTSLDVCDALGLSGLTISSDTNCLQISGGVSYEFNWGDYRHTGGLVSAPGYSGSDLILGGTPFGNTTTLGSSEDVVGLASDDRGDWDSKVEAWLKFVGTSDSDFGPAKAVLKIKSVSQTRVINADDAVAGAILGNNGNREVDDRDFNIDEGYVSIGDSTVIMAGKKSSIANFGDSEPFNFTKLFAWDAVDDGVGFDADGDRVNFTGGHVIQVVSDLGNGLNVGVGLENLNSQDADTVGATTLSQAHGAGTLVGVLSYAGEGITAHVTGLAIGILDGQVDAWGIHAGATGTFDNFRVRAAVGYLGKDYSSFGGIESNRLHAMLTGEATFDMFTVALSGEYARTEGANGVAGAVQDGFGIGGSVGAAVTDGVKINLGARYFDNSNNVANDETLQVSAQLVAAVTETITVTGEVGAYWNDSIVGTDSPLVYGAAQLAWAPGGGFTTSIKGEANSDGAYRATYKAAKSFE